MSMTGTGCCWVHSSASMSCLEGAFRPPDRVVETDLLLEGYIQPVENKVNPKNTAVLLTLRSFGARFWSHACF